jgi:hypothetical protein
VFGGAHVCQALEELFEIALRCQPARRDVRHRDEAQVPGGLGRRHPHLQVLVAEEGDVDTGAGRNLVFCLDEGGNVLAGHFQREIFDEFQ